MEPLDLTVRPPRGCYEELDGLMFMPRTIDKIRAMLDGGKKGEYIINAQVTGISGFLLERLGITEAELREAVKKPRTTKPSPRGCEPASTRASTQNSTPCSPESKSNTPAIQISSAISTKRPSRSIPT